MSKSSILSIEPDILNNLTDMPLVLRDKNGTALYTRPAPDDGWNVPELHDIILNLEDASLPEMVDFYIGETWIGGMS